MTESDKEIITSNETFKDSREQVRGHGVVDKIRKRLIENKVPFFANDTLFAHVSKEELKHIQQRVEDCCQELLKALLIDTQKDHNTKETAKRMAKMYLYEVMKGRYTAPPEITTFPNAKKLDEIYTTGPITVRSMCSHHFVPIMGKCWIGVLPSDKVFGLSKFNRVVDWIASRPQIQEELVIQIADALEEILNPQGLAIVLNAEHMCMQWRGVKDCGSMSNSVVRGIFAKNPHAKQEFFEIIKGQGFHKGCRH